MRPAHPGPPTTGLPALVLAAVLAAVASAPVRAHDELAPTRAEIARLPPGVDRWLRQAELARLDRDLAGAAEALEHAAALAPSSPSVALGRAALALDRGELDRALRELESALSAHDLSAREAAHGSLLLARVRIARHSDPHAVLAAYDDAFRRAPHPHADVALERARFALEHGLRDEAAAGLAVAQARLPHDPAIAATRDALRGIERSGRRPPPVLPGGRPGSVDFGSARPELASLSPGKVAADVLLLSRGSTWRYSATGSEPAGWTTLGYDDGAWPAGPAALGFGDPFIVTPVPMGPNATTRYWTTYFRTRFEVADPPASFLTLTLFANYDDGFVARLNGVEIARRALPAGPIVYSTPASLHEAGAFEAIDVTAAGLPALVAGTNVLAVEVHQASTTSSDLAWDGELVATNATLAITRGPYLQNATPGAITVRWRTSAPTDTRVWLGEAPDALAIAATDPAPTTEHEVRLTGLTPGTTHFYAVGTTTGVLAGDDSAHAFATPPPAGEARTTRVWVLGDSGLPGIAQDDVRDAYLEWTGTVPTDVWLMLGDNAYVTGTDPEYTAGLFAPYASFLRGHCLWPTRGNHDFLHAGGNNDYYDHFTLPTAGEAGGVPSSTEAWYAFDHGDIHFVCLDSEGSSLAPGSPMLTWLEADLAANARRWVIAFWHHPPYTKGSHDSDDAGDSFGKMRDMRQNVLPVLESYGADLVLTGHSHSYERSFLLDGHYGTSGTLQKSMILDAGDGDPAGDGAYHKPSAGMAPHEGSVFAVAGSSARIDGGTLDHPVMVRSLNVLGSLVVDVDADSLVGTFLDDGGATRDRFVIRKGPTVVAGPGGSGAARGLELRIAGANPVTAGRPVRLAYALPRAGHAAITVVDATGRRVRALAAGRREAGAHAATWDGNDESGRRAPAGLYFALLDADGARRTARIVVVP